LGDRLALLLRRARKPPSGDPAQDALREPGEGGGDETVISPPWAPPGLCWPDEGFVYIWPWPLPPGELRDETR
jgi:hypothetical protein